jgi:hypothetical protein
MSDFRRCKWQVPGTTNSVPKLSIKPQVTMIQGIDSIGNIYYSLAQANSNSSMIPYELFFAEFKKVDINPRNIPIGKTQFDKVAKLVRLIIERMNRSHIVLYWHHCLEYVYRYLTFHRL